jgi:2-hydroxychromene-2-carboxylate isomerase
MTDDRSITFWFDPICPFTWRTSRWARDVAGRQGAPVTWRVMSLAILNEGGEEPPEQYREVMRQSPRLLRLLVAAERRDGQAAVDRLYTAVGQRMHDKGESIGEELLTAALDDAGLPAELLAAADDASLDQAVRASHEEAQERVGTEAGSPIVAIGAGPGFFGPVVAPVPDEAAGDRLFEALRLLSSVPQFSELKRARNPF